MERTVKVGKLPGRLVEVLLAEETTVGQALDLAGLEVGNFEIKVDGVTRNIDDVVPSSAVYITLVEKVKGAVRAVKVGKLPGRLEEVLLEENTTVGQAIELAGLSIGNFEIKVDGNTMTSDVVVPENAVYITLVEKVKGAVRSVKVGKLPGRLEEVLLEENTTIGEAIELAGLSIGSFEVKVDGVTFVNNDAYVPENAVYITLVEKVKGAK